MDHPFDDLAVKAAERAIEQTQAYITAEMLKSQAARIEALEEALKDAQGVLMTRNQQIEELRDRLALLNETQSH